jgi:MarR family transcriptional regulator, transcriptional regulator for hemolysin
MNRRPSGPPIGIVLSSVAREAERAFDAALEAVGGSRPTWLVLMALKQGPLRNQRQLATMVGIESATLTHHLNGMEAAGLLTRRRDPANRRVHLVELTAEGEAAFHRMLGTVIAFDKRLRSGSEGDDLALVERVLLQIRANVAPQRQDEPGGADAAVAEAGIASVSN